MASLERAHLNRHDQERINRALDQVADRGHPVALRVYVGTEEFRILVSRMPLYEEILRSRQQRLLRRSDSTGQPGLPGSPSAPPQQPLE